MKLIFSILILLSDINSGSLEPTTYKETLYCDAKSAANHITIDNTPWLALIFVSKYADPDPDGNPFQFYPKSEKKITFAENITVFEYPLRRSSTYQLEAVIHQEPICFGVILTNSVILASSYCYFKAQNVILDRDPISEQREEMLVLTGSNTKKSNILGQGYVYMRLSKVVQDKTEISDEAKLVLMVLEKPLVFNDHVHPIDLPMKNTLKRKIGQIHFLDLILI